MSRCDDDDVLVQINIRLVVGFERESSLLWNGDLKRTSRVVANSKRDKERKRGRSTTFNSSRWAEQQQHWERKKPNKCQDCTRKRKWRVKELSATKMVTVNVDLQNGSPRSGRSRIEKSGKYFSWFSFSCLYSYSSSQTKRKRKRWLRVLFVAPLDAICPLSSSQISLTC